MTIKPIKLDKQFGLFEWGVISSRPIVEDYCDYTGEYSPRFEGDTVILEQAEKCISQKCFYPDAINSKSFTIPEMDKNCHGEGGFEPKEISVQAVEPIISYNIPITRDLILLMYQAFVERLGISRSMTDSYTVFEEAMRKEKSLNCVGFDSWAFPDMGGSEKCYVEKREMRRRAGGINQARVDGKTFREFMRLLYKFLNEAKKNDVLYPITPVVGTNNFPDANKLNPFRNINWWTNLNPFGDRYVDIEQRWSNFKTQILGFASCGTQEIKGSWAGDITLSKGMESLGIEEKDIGHIKQNSIIADIINEVFKNASFHNCNSYYNDNPVERFLELVKQEESTAQNDISGEYINYADSLSRNTIRYHLPTYGYGWTILGAFGQNVVRYPIDSFTFRNRKVNAERRIGYEFIEIPNCGCGIAGFAMQLGDKFFTIRNAYDCQVFDAYNVTRDYTTAYAQVDGYGGAMPVIYFTEKFNINDRIILDRMFEEAMENSTCAENCVIIDYSSLLSERAVCAVYYHSLVGGELSFSLDAEWTNKYDDSNDVRLNSNRFVNRYPAQGVFGNMYKPFLRDVNVLYPLHRCVDELAGCGSGYYSYPFTSLYFRPNVNTENVKCWLEQDAQKVATESYDWILDHRGKYVSTGIYTYFCTVRDGGADLPNGVVTVNRFPITETDVFGSGDNSLLSVKSWDCFMGQIAVEGTVEVLQIKLKRVNGSGFPIPVEALTRERYSGVDFLSWNPIEVDNNEYSVGWSQYIKTYRVFKGHYEPYAQMEINRISLGSPFGIVRWNYQAAKGVV